MTREEIHEWFKRIVAAQGAGTYGLVESELVEFYRATLEEAARAVCSKCARNENIADDGLHEPSLEECDAVRVWDLIAAMESEGKT